MTLEEANRIAQQRIAELETENTKLKTDIALRVEGALADQMVELEAEAKRLEKHLDMLKFFCDSLIGTSMEHPRSPIIWTIVMTPAFENLKRFLAELGRDK